MSAGFSLIGILIQFAINKKEEDDDEDDYDDGDDESEDDDYEDFQFREENLPPQNERRVRR